MAWTGLTLTVEGRNALNQAQIANRINFKSIVVGDGKAPANFRTLKELVHQLYEITDIKVDMTEDGCTVTADFPKVDYDYYFREIGIIVTTDEGDRLYVYDNCGEDAQYMVSSTGVETTKKRIRLSLAISDVAEITVSAAEILYVAYDDYEKTVEILKQELQGESERAKEEEQSLTEKLQEEANRAQAEEETNRNNLVNHVADKTNPHKVTKAQVGLGNVDNTADVNKPVSTAQQNALDSAYRQATGYTDRKIADLIGGAPETLDTLKEVADAIQANKDVSTALDAAIGKKANQTELDTHTGNNTIHITSAERTNWNAAKTHADSAHARTDATKTEKSNTNGNVKINGTETTVYTHPNTAGNKHIPSGGSSGQILRWSSDGAAAWGGDNDTKVTQQNVTANADNRLLLSSNANDTNETAYAKKSQHFLANPYTGELYANGYRRIILDGQTQNLDSITLSAGYPMVKYYIERTDGGASKITNAPIAGKPFLLDVELIRWASVSDYITMQTFRNASDYTHEYVRICNSGTWTAWQKRIFTDTNTTYGTATQTANGLLSATDKKKLDGVADGANKIIVDSSLSASSTNPVQNKVVKNALDGKANANHSHDNIRQVLTVTSGKTITISCPVLAAGGGGVVLADYISVRRLTPGYSNIPLTMYVKQTMKYEVAFQAPSGDQTISSITASAVNENGIIKITLTSNNNGYTSSNGLQLEYTVSITSITVS